MPERFSNSENENLGGDFLKEKYPDLPKSPEVESAAKRQEIRTGEKIKNNPKEKIGVYLNRLNEIFNPEDDGKKEFRVNFLKEKLHDKFVIKEIPESYFNQQQRIAREQGHGDIEINDQLKEEALKTIAADQEKSLDNWVDYLGSSDATYPDWLKYWAFRSITGLSQYDKEAHEFKKRSKTTTAPFPDINREALAYVLDAVEKQQKEKKNKNKTEIQPTDEEWEKLLKTQNFGKLYAHAIEKITPASEEEKENIQGEWIKYDQGSDAKPLYESLQGHGTGWCTAGQSMAEAQLKAGDFYVFYSKDKQGLPKIPRVAIRMENGEIAEVRGIEAEQNLEPLMADVTKEKMQTLPGGEKYEKKVSDMKRLTEIESKTLPLARKIRALEDDIQKDLGDNAILELTGLYYLREEFLKNRVDYLISEISKLESDKLYLQEKKLKIQNSELTRTYIDEENEIKICEDEIRRIKSLITKFDKCREEFSKENKLDKNNLELSKEELRFLYEIDDNIEGFGYQKNPRIEEIKESRNEKNDYARVFNCELEEVSLDGHIDDKTIVVIGDLNPYGSIIYQDLKNLKYITGKAIFTGTESLGSLEKIGRDADFRNSKIKDLGQLKTIGGSAYIDKDCILDFSKIEIGGELFK